MLRIGILLIALSLVTAILQGEETDLASGDFKIKLPLGVPWEIWSYFIPRDNAMTAAKVRLGRELFFDKRLSADGSISCATCHDPALAFTDGKSVAVGVHGRRGIRNSPSLLNAMFHSGQFLDGRVTTLEAQAKIPLISANEMDNVSHDQLVARLRAIPEYGQQCQQIFGGPVTIECISKAIAAFERTLLSGNSPYDRFAAGDSHALTEAAKRGLALFRGKGRCSGCHIINEPFQFFTDRTYRNTGVSARNPAFETLARRAREWVRLPHPPALNLLASQEGASELGRFLITGNSLDIGAFKIPSLRDVELTAPYFHDGSAQTLADVVRFYAGGGADSPNRDWELQGIVLTEPEQADVVEFLKSLTSDDTRRSAGADSYTLKNRHYIFFLLDY